MRGGICRRWRRGIGWPCVFGAIECLAGLVPQILDNGANSRESLGVEVVDFVVRSLTVFAGLFMFSQAFFLLGNEIPKVLVILFASVAFPAIYMTLMFNEYSTVKLAVWRRVLHIIAFFTIVGFAWPLCAFGVLQILVRMKTIQQIQGTISIVDHDFVFSLLCIVILTMLSVPIFYFVEIRRSQRNIGDTRETAKNAQSAFAAATFVLIGYFGQMGVSYAYDAWAQYLPEQIRRLPEAACTISSESKRIRDFVRICSISLAQPIPFLLAFMFHLIGHLRDFERSRVEP